MFRSMYIATLLVVALFGVAPMVCVLMAGDRLSLEAIATLNLVGWCVAMTFILARADLARAVNRMAARLGIGGRGLSIERVLRKILDEIERKNRALAMDLVERRISSKEDLSRCLEKIVGLAFKLLEAESAELALFDKASGMYHSSFVLGKPFNSSAQAMLAGAMETEVKEEIGPDIIIQPVSFGGQILGSLRVALRRGRIPTVADQEIMRMLSVQGSLAIINGQYNEELLKMRRNSEESLKAKTGFLANLSHEVRGPLGIMLNAVELVLDGLCGATTADQVETLRMVRQNGEHLLELINDVLDYAKSESGRVVPEKVQIVVNDFLQDVSNVVRTQAEAKKHRLIFRASDTEFAMLCDRRHARQMLINLLTNAIKYTPDGGEITVWADRSAGNRVKIHVKDSGVGIEKTQRHKVFAAFERVENAYSMKQVGTGLGMPLTKKLAEANGGTIDFESEPGKGSHFWILLPSIEYQPKILAETPKETREITGQGEAILVIEHAEGERQMMSRYLSHAGFKVYPAGSRLEALEIANHESIDIVLIDNDVLEESGSELIEAIRGHSRPRSVPMILVSSRAFIFDVEKYLRMGIDRCISKPFELRALAECVREVLDGRGGAASQKEPLRSGMLKRSLGTDDLMH